GRLISGTIAGREVGAEDVAVDHAGRIGKGAVARFQSRRVDDISKGHLVDPALVAVGAEDEPERSRSVEELDLVTLVEQADLGRPKLIGGIEQADEPITDPSALATLDRADGPGLERQLHVGGHAPEGVRLASRHERW